ncbi:MAG: IPT/TIG domain-containing protein, partial [Methylotenera sp.]|nr:IPT/TIG domain-containing protein [Methylotenera sp.]
MVYRYLKAVFLLVLVLLGTLPAFAAQQCFSQSGTYGGLTVTAVGADCVQADSSILPWNGLTSAVRLSPPDGANLSVTGVCAYQISPSVSAASLLVKLRGLSCHSVAGCEQAEFEINEAPFAVTGADISSASSEPAVPFAVASVTAVSGAIVGAGDSNTNGGANVSFASSAAASVSSIKITNRVNNAPAMTGGAIYQVCADDSPVVAAPTVTAVSPSSGSTAGGTSVTITGTNLTDATAVTIGGAACTSPTVVSETSITCTTPAGSAGSASVWVTTPAGTNNANTLFTYMAAQQCFSQAGTYGSLTVTTVGACVQYTGNFLPYNGLTSALYLSPPNASNSNQSVTDSCTFQVSPSVSAATLVVKLRALTCLQGVGCEQSELEVNGTPFLVTDSDLSDVPSNESSPVPATHVTTASGAIVGPNDSSESGGANVSFANSPASPVSSIKITNRITQLANSGGALYQVCADDGPVVAVPTVTAVNPSSGSTAGGTSVTITGTNLTNASAVTLGGNACTPLSANTSTSVTCTTPAGSAGTASVLVTTPGGTNSANTLFTYVTPVSAPTVTAISPASGTTAGGSTVTITGTNLTNASAVTIGGNACTPLSANTATSVTCTTSAGSAGTASVLVTTPGGTNSANTLFTYFTPVSAPTVTAISPTSGTTAGGISVTITGTNLTNASAVTVGGNACTPLSNNTSTSVTCTTPAGSAGTASVLVTTPGGTNSANTLFTYTANANSACGSAQGQATSVLPSLNLCSIGNASGVTAAAGGYSWSCTGSGNPASC